MSYGKIYKTTWWGTAHLANNNFGKIYKDIASSVVKIFKSRVQADGGTFEAQTCLEESIDIIKAI